MELLFLDTHVAYVGSNPAVAHMDDNTVYGFQVDTGKLTAASVASSEEVDWDTVALSDFTIAKNGETSISLARFKTVPRMGIYGTWKQAAVMEGEEEVTPERHRFAIWNIAIDVSKHLENCTIELREDSPIASMTMTLSNPNQEVVGEDDTEIIPGNRIDLYLTMGDSEEYPMGVQYIDRVDVGVLKKSTSLECRSITGKLLKDQTFDTDYLYSKQVYHLNVETLLDSAGIVDYEVQENLEPGAWEFGISFPHNLSMLEGLFEMITASQNWKVIESLDGTIIAGSTVSYSNIQVNSKYTFNRGTDVFSRNVTRDDANIYAKVCCYYDLEGVTQYVYETVTNAGDWDIPGNKTLYVELADNTLLADAEQIASDIAQRISNAGTVETFFGPIRPQLLPGDSAEIISTTGTYLLGVITTVRHVMGRSGYTTEFTVDSGGCLGQAKISDYIGKITKDKTSSSSRIYE